MSHPHPTKFMPHPHPTKLMPHLHPTKLMPHPHPTKFMPHPHPTKLMSHPRPTKLVHPSSSFIILALGESTLTGEFPIQAHTKVQVYESFKYPV